MNYYEYSSDKKQSTKIVVKLTNNKASPKNTNSSKKAKVSQSPKINSKKTPEKKNKSPVKTSLNIDEDEQKSKNPQNNENKTSTKLIFGTTAPDSAKKPNDYNPSTAKYHPINDAIWKHKEKYNLYT